MAGKFRVGSMVIISTPGISDEEAVVLGEETPDYPGIYIVRVTNVVLNSGDDGLREVAEEFMNAVL